MEEKLTAQFEQIGAEEAKALLSGNRGNRPVNRNNLAALEYELRRGNFKVTGESVKISKTGALIDGQHRLLAIANVNPAEKIEMVVVRGLDDEAFKFIDTGRKRTASDVLAVQGVINAPKIAAIAKFVINFDRGQYTSAADNQNKDKSLLTNNDISKFVLKHREELNTSFKYGYNQENKLINKGVLASFHYLANKISPTDADYFCQRVSDGASLEADSPIYQLRARMLNDIRSVQKLNGTHKLALLCKAWNIYRAGGKANTLRWNSTTEPFPKLK